MNGQITRQIMLEFELARAKDFSELVRRERLREAIRSGWKTRSRCLTFPAGEDLYRLPA